MSHEWKGTHLWVSVGFPLWFESHWIWWANQICKEQLSRLFCRNHCFLTELVQVLLQTLAFCLWSHCFVLDSQWPFLWRSQWWKAPWRAWRQWKRAWWKRRQLARLHEASWQRWWSSKAIRRDRCEKQILWSKNIFFKVAVLATLQLCFSRFYILSHFSKSVLSPVMCGTCIVD